MSSIFGFLGILGPQYGDFSQQQALANQAMAQAQMNAMMNAAYANRSNPLQSSLQSQGTASQARAYMNTVKSSLEPCVASTAASRVDKPDWEKRADAKDAELNEWLHSIGLGHIADMDFEE